MKKILSLLIAMALAFSLVACDKDATDDPDTPVVDDNDDTDDDDDVIDYANDGVIDWNDLTAKDPLEESNDYRMTYSLHYETLNYLESQSANDNEYVANMVDALVEVDRFNSIVPGLATDWSTEMVDGKQVWTFHIRENVYWQDNETLEPVALVTANDWVTSANYILEPAYSSELISLLNTFVDGGENYYCSKLAEQAEANGDDAPKCTEAEGYEFNTDFSQVGVKAVDDYTLQYTLVNPAPYFITVLTYNSYYPVLEEFLLEQGEDFGIDSTHLLINGAYSMTDDVQDNKIELTRNPYYWDAEHVYVEKILWIFTVGDLGADYLRKLYEAGAIDAFKLSEVDQVGLEYYIYGPNGDGTFEDPARPEAIVRGTVSPYTRHWIWNYGRESYLGSELTDAEHDASTIAKTNADFRLGFTFGFDKEIFLTQYTPEEPFQYARNVYSPRELAVDSSGRDYVEYVYDVISEKEGIPREDVNAMYDDGNEAMYQPERAMEHFVAAKEALIADKGLTEADFPVKIEIIGTYNANYLPYYQSAADNFNAEFGDYMELTVMVPSNYDEFASWAWDNQSYDMYVNMGWGPDYQDPKTYLNTYAINGDMLAYAGLGADDMELQEEIMGEFDELFRIADAYNSSADVDMRMRKFAEAEYKFLFEDAIIYVMYSQRGNDVIVSNVKPFQINSATYGSGQYRYKGIIVLDEAVSAEERAALEAEFEAARG